MFNDVLVTVMVQISVQTITEMCLVARSTIRPYYVEALWPPRPGGWHVNVSKHWYDFDADLTKLKLTLPHFRQRILLEILFQFKFFQKQKQIHNYKLRKSDRVRVVVLVNKGCWIDRGYYKQV